MGSSFLPRRNLYKPLVRNLLWAWLPALLLLTWAKLINARWLDGLFDVHYNTPFQDKLMTIGSIALLVGWIAGVAFTISFLFKERNRIGDEALFVGLMAFAFLPLFASLMTKMPPMVDLSNCQYEQHSANLMCEENVGWFK